MAEEPGPKGPTLGRLVHDLGASVLGVLEAPSGLDVVATNVVIDDPTDDVTFEFGDIVLAVGTRPDSPAAEHLVRRAAEHGVSAVVFKFTDDGMTDATVALAREGGTALLIAAPAIAWAQLQTLVRNVLASASDALDGADAPGGARVGDLFTLANAVAGMIGGAVSIEDPQSRVLAYSDLDVPLDEARRETILGRHVPKRWVKRLAADGVFRRLWAGQLVRVDGLVEDDGSELRSRLAIAVRAGDEILGSIWVSEGERPFDAASESALTEAARIAALHLVRHRAGDDLDRRMRGELLRSLLEGRGPLHVLADRLGLEADGLFAVVAFELPADDEAEVALLRHRVTELISLYCEAFRRRAAHVPLGKTIFSLLPVTEDDPAGSLTRLADDVSDRAKQVLSVQLVAGIGSVVEHLRDVPRSRSDAELVLRVLAQRPGEDPPVATIEQVRARAMLMELRDLLEDHPHLLNGRLRSLLESDEERQTEYVPTLRAYLDHFGDAPAAAASVDVHPNTFRYRLKRACEVAELDLTDRYERLAVELQLQML